MPVFLRISGRCRAKARRRRQGDSVIDDIGGKLGLSASCVVRTA
jgi:hypothetical protein